MDVLFKILIQLFLPPIFIKTACWGGKKKKKLFFLKNFNVEMKFMGTNIEGEKNACYIIDMIN